MSDYPSNWGNEPPQDFPPRNAPPSQPYQPPPQSYPPPGPTPPPSAPEPGYGAPPTEPASPYAPPPAGPYAPPPGGPFGPPPADPYGAAPPPTAYGVPYTAPPQAPSGPPPKVRTRPRVWPWLLGFLALFVVLIGGCSYWVYSLAKGPIDAVNSYVAALDEGRYQDAYDGLCATTRQTVSFQQFQGDNSGAPRISGYTFASVAAETGELTRVGGTVDLDGAPVTTTFGLQREGGDWKICEYFPLQ